MAPNFITKRVALISDPSKTYILSVSLYLQTVWKLAHIHALIFFRFDIPPALKFYRNLNFFKVDLPFQTYGVYPTYVLHTQ